MRAGQTVWPQVTTPCWGLGSGIVETDVRDEALLEMLGNVVVDCRLVALERIADWTCHSSRSELCIRRPDSIVLSLGCTINSRLGLATLAFPLRRYYVGTEIDLLRRRLGLVVQAHVTVLAATARGEVGRPRVGKIYDRCSAITTARVGRANVVSAGLTLAGCRHPGAHALDAADPAVCQTNFDAPMVVATGQNIFDYALNLAPGALVCLEDDADTSTWNNLSYVRNRHGMIIS